MSWHLSAISPSHYRARRPRNASATLTAPSRCNLVQARAQAVARHHRSPFNSSKGFQCHRRRAASVGVAAARHSLISYTRTPRHSRRNPRRKSCLTHHSRRASRTRICQHTAMSLRGFPVTCSNPRGRRRGLHHLKRTHTAISISNTRQPHFTRLRQAISKRRMGPPQARRRTRPLSHRKWGHRHRLYLPRALRRPGSNSKEGKMQVGAWTYGTRCRLATSAYPSRSRSTPAQARVFLGTG